MNIAVEFFKENVLLIGLALGAFVTLLWPMLNRSAAGVKSVSVTEAVMLMTRQKPLLLDVRDSAEFALGHIAGARNIPLAALSERLTEVQAFKDKPVLVMCQSGVRAKTACTILKSSQFSQLYQLNGGLNAWIEGKMPIAKR